VDQKTISKEQQKLNATLHQDDRYGNRDKAAGLATKLPKALDRMHELKFCSSFLDYGTGKGKLLQYIRSSITHPIALKGYDPAVEQYSSKPNETFDIVTCLDVLEHIELDTIDNVITDIKNYTNNFCYLVIDLQPAVKTLADGRNAHILLAPPDWWHNKISQHFKAFTTFPLYHQSGDIQKIAVLATNNFKSIKAMHGFAIKLDIFEMKLQGGLLDKKVRYRKKN
tara:strand:- start:2654 stop:3328 length:675 start_codon:yes stop_codon:yes gene_type:complete